MAYGVIEDISNGVIEDISTITGLTEREQTVMEHILVVWNAFQELSSSHPDEVIEFRRSIHEMQCAMGMRILRREYPKGWYSPPGWYVKGNDYGEGIRVDAARIPNDMFEIGDDIDGND